MFHVFELLELIKTEPDLIITSIKTWHFIAEKLSSVHFLRLAYMTCIKTLSQRYNFNPGHHLSTRCVPLSKA